MAGGADEMTIAEMMPSLAETHRVGRDQALKELAYYYDRRDKLFERIRFGVLTLNGASLIALISALGGTGAAATWLGFTQDNVIYSAAAFTLGTIAAGVGIAAQQFHYQREALDGFLRASALSSLAAHYERKASPEALDKHEQDMDALAKLPLTGFQHSHVAIWAQNFSQGAWLAGILVPLSTAIGLG